MKIVHASISENNNAGWDGKAKTGDQTKKEVCITELNTSNWRYIIRCKDFETAKKAVKTAIELANSNKVGYNQANRNSLYTALALNKFDVKKYLDSGALTDTDCSAFIYACYACHMSKIRSTANAPTTSIMQKFYSVNGFDCFNYGAKTPRTGDILVTPSVHTVLVV